MYGGQQKWRKFYIQSDKYLVFLPLSIKKKKAYDNLKNQFLP